MPDARFRILSRSIIAIKNLTFLKAVDSQSFRHPKFQ